MREMLTTGLFAVLLRTVQIQTSPSHLSYGYDTQILLLIQWLCPSDTDIIITNLTHVYSTFTSPNNLVQFNLYPT